MSLNQSIASFIFWECSALNFSHGASSVGFGHSDLGMHRFSKNNVFWISRYSWSGSLGKGCLLLRMIQTVGKMPKCSPFSIPSQDPCKVLRWYLAYMNRL